MRVALSANDVEVAKTWFYAAAKRGLTPLARAHAHYGLSRLAMVQIDTRTTLAEANGALKELGLPPLEHSARGYLRAVVFFWWAYVKKNWLKRVEPRRPDDALVAQLYFSAGNAAYFLMNRTLVLQASLLGYPHVARLGATRETTNWYAFASVPAGIAGRLSLAARLMASARALADSLRDPTAQGLALGLAGVSNDMGGEPVLGAQLSGRGVAEFGRWMELPDLLTLSANQSWNFLMRGFPETSWRYTEECLRRIVEAGDTLSTRGHTFRCYAGPSLTMQGKTEEGRKHLDAFAEVLRVYAADDKWRNMQWLAHKTLAMQLAQASDEEMEALFEAHARFNLKAKSHPHQLKQFFLAKAACRLDQAERDLSASSQARAEQAVADTRQLGAHPTIALHHDVLEARLGVLRGAAPVEALTALHTRALSLEAPWPAADAASVLARWFSTKGDATSATHWSSIASALHEKHGLVALARRHAPAA